MESELISANVKLTHALNDKVKLIADVELAEERTAQTEAMLRQEKVQTNGITLIIVLCTLHEYTALQYM